MESTSLSDLPDHLWVLLVHHLSLPDLLSFSRTCRRAKATLWDDDNYWRAKCQDCGVTELTGWPVTGFRDLYLRFLLRYSHLIGLHKVLDAPFGGVILVRPEPPALVAYSVIAFKLNGPAQLRRVFTITCQEDGPAMVRCNSGVLSQDVGHSAQLGALPTDTSQQITSLKCSKGCKHTDFDPLLRHTGRVEGIQLQSMAVPAASPQIPEVTSTAAEQHFVHFVLTHTSFLLNLQPQHMEYYGFVPPADSAEALYYQKLEVPGRSAHPIAGLWRGTYFAHGMELLLLEVVVQRNAVAGQLAAAAPLVLAAAAPPTAAATAAVAAAAPTAGPPASPVQAWQSNIQDSSSASQSPRSPITTPDEAPSPPAPTTGQQRSGLGQQLTAADHTASAAAASSSGDSSGSGSSSGSEAAGTSSRSASVQAHTHMAMLQATKLSGDRNVPASRVSFQVDLSQPHPRPTCLPGTQFRLPPGYTTCVDLEDPAVPPESLRVQAVYLGNGQVSPPRFQAPEWTPVEMVVFSNDCFGLMWHLLNKLSMFSRVHWPGAE